MPRTGGNPDFGTKFRFDYGNEEKRDVALTIRITQSELDRLKNIAGDRYRDFCRDAINDAAERHKAAEATKTETTGQEQAGQQPQESQTNQEDQEQEASPSQGEPEATPGKRGKAHQTQRRKPTRPTTQTQTRKNTGKKKATD